MIALLVSVILTGGGGQFPLAAAFVVDGKILIAQMGSREQQEIPVADMVIRSADLSPDKSTVVAAAQLPGSPLDQLFLFDRKEMKWARLETGIKGAHRTPRFTPDGKFITFAASNSEESGPDHPTQVWRVERSPKAVAMAKRLSVQPEYCHFSPSPLGADKFASIGTNCFFDFEVRLVGASKNMKLGSAHGVHDEVAGSFDGDAVLTTERLDGEFVLSVFRKGAEKKRLHSFRSTTATAPQPKFVCPRDVMFIENSQFKVLNTKSGEVKTVAEGAP